MKLVKLHDPRNGILNIIGFMSGTGTNLRKVCEHEKNLSAKPQSPPFHVCAIFSDNATSAAAEIGREFNLPVVIRDIGAFYKAHGYKKRDLCLRPSYDAETVKALEPFRARFAVFAGYMSIASKVLIESFIGINVHPGDLAAVKGGKRIWTGSHAVLDAIVAGEKRIRSTTHLVEADVDCGRVLMRSRPLDVRIPDNVDLQIPEQAEEVAAQHQNELKQTGDWEILPLSIEYIASGRYAKDEEGNLYFDSRPIPDGFDLE